MTKFNERKRIQAFYSPAHAIADWIRCKTCHGATVLIGGKAVRNYGCYNAMINICKNRLLIPRNGIEAIIINGLKETFLIDQNIISFSEDPEQTSRHENSDADLQILLNAYYVAHTSIQFLSLLDRHPNTETFTNGK